MRARRRPTKKFAADINRQILELADECNNAAYPESNWRKRATNGIPLTAFLSNANTKGSRIEHVRQQNMVYFGCPLYFFILRIADRVVRREAVTSAQYDLIVLEISKRYRGDPFLHKYDSSGAKAYPENTIHAPGLNSLTLLNLLGKRRLSLRFLTDKRLADLLLLKTLTDTLAR